MTTRFRIFTTLLVFALVLTPFAQSAMAADDITGNTHEAELREMVELGVMNGYGNGIYKPNAQITRGQFSALLTRALNIEPAPEGLYFSDLGNSGVVNEVLAAANAGLVTGYLDGTFKPAKPISREHIAVLIKRAMDYLQMEDKSAPLNFADQSLIFKSYHNAISNNVAYNIFRGSTINGKVYFRPDDNATRGEAAAVVSRLLKAAKAAQPEEPDEAPALTYNVATVDKTGKETIIKKYSTFEQAEKALKSGQVVTYDGAIVRMLSGTVVTAPTTASSLTSIYEKPDLKTHFTYVSADTELEYFGSTADAVQVKVAGKTGYIKHANAILKTWDMMTGRSYYDLSGGDLRHNIYQNQTGRYVSYSLGKAPAAMKAGQKYFSWDGIEFLDASGKVAAKGYNYFQFLPARSKTSYTAEQLDAYIVKELQSLEAKNPSNATYKDASKRSKLIGIGTHLKKVEKEQGVNALMILAIAQHESNYGLSTRALNFNNLFGLRVYDDNPANDKFATVAENVDELMSDFWNKNYIPPNAAYANGAVFGNKSLGMNMRYASDAYWGAKAAGHMYRIDKALGGRDLNAYPLGMTTETGLNARSSAQVTDSNKLFTYNAAGLPVVLLEEIKAGGRTWYKTSSDDIRYPEVFFAGEYIQKLQILK